MWLLTAPFDGDLGDLSAQKTKLLKPGSSYLIGRKGTHFIVNNKKISHEHGEFQVAPMSAQDASNPGFTPALTYYGKKKPWSYTRGGERVQVLETQVAELKDGDTVSIAGGIEAKVVWMRVCVFSSAPKGKLPVQPEICASLGINYSLEPAAEVTHHLTSTYSATPSLATSLIASCQIVKPEWLEEVIRLVESSTDSFPTLPQVTKYRPTFSSSLPPTHKVFKVWEPNEERLGLFRKFRFLCVGEKAREVSLEFRTLINRGEGSIEVFDVTSGIDKFQKAVRRGLAKEGKSLILLGEQSSLEAAIGKNAWAELVNEAKGVGARFVSHDTLVEAVLNVDTTLLESSSASRSIPENSRSGDTSADITMSTPMEERQADAKEDSPPPAPAPRRRLLKRSKITADGESEAGEASTSATPAATPVPTPPAQPVIPSLLDLDAPAPPPRRPLLRRRPPSAQPEDTSGTPNAGDMPPPPPPAPSVLDLDTPLPQRRLLKRRTREKSVDPTPAAATGSLLGQSSVLEDSLPLRPPPLKKFKALFEASDPSRLESGFLEDSAGGGGEGEGGGTFGNGSGSIPGDSNTSDTQTQTQTGRTQRRLASGGSSGLDALREEEEEESMRQTQGGTVVRGKKRGIEDVDGDAEMGDNTAKKQAVDENRVDGGEPRQMYTPNGVLIPPDPSSKKPVAVNGKDESSKKKDKAKGAPLGEPDKDAAFLKAVASTKKGKKHEDDFDREFNKLKISKPVVLKEVEVETAPEDQWKVLEDFGDDSGVRGNFMTICEMPVFRERGNRKEREMNPEWQGMANFKKFKKKIAPGTEKPKVDLFVNNSEEPSHRKASSSQAHKTQAMNGPRGKKRLATLDEDREMSDGQHSGDEVEALVQPVKKRARTGSVSSTLGTANKPPSRAGSRAASRSRSVVPTQTKGKGRAKSQQSADEDRLFLSDEDESQSRFGFQTQPNTRRSGRKADVMAMDVDVIDMTLEDGGEQDEDDEEFGSGTIKSLERKVEKAKTRQQSQAPEKGTGKATKGKGTKKKPVVVHDDSDDDAVFKGF
ncbi:hypothetical protein BKA70DRAFT_512449 [Coprinopsis sp. MPI-PUGE-AT-0042]|nr:hypothetical protein BKA70DRAFT_512449 [Coprinopsis sp. MPI-PUGE-AT-0042]